MRPPPAASGIISAATNETEKKSVSTFIAFSGTPGDSIYVEEDVATVRAALSPDAPGYATLTQVPLQTDPFEKSEILLNTSRVAFVRGA